MDYNLILKQSKELLSDYNDYSSKKKFKEYDYEKFESEMITTYSYLHKNINTIFNLCICGDMNLKILTYMINSAKDIKKNKISNYDASVKVGNVLVDTFVKPKINDNKETI